MSGGHFDYNQYKIDEIANDIELVLMRQGKELPHKKLYAFGDYYEKYPDERYYITYPEEIQQKMREAVRQLRIAYIYAHRIDWFLSDDDSEENFLRRLQDELDALP